MVSKIGIMLTVSVGIAGMSCSSDPGGIDEQLVPVQSGDSWGYVDLEGHYVVNPQFSSCFPYTDGCAVVFKGNKCGYIDKEGIYVIQPDFIDGLPFSEGGAWTIKPGGAPTLIDKKGKELLVMKNVERAWAFTEGLALVRMADDKYGYINHDGKMVVSPIFDNANPFSEGLAKVKQGNKFGFIDKAGKWVICDSILKPETPFINGMAVVSNSDGLMGAIDKSGKIIINPQFEKLIPDGDWFIIENSNEFGWCDKSGKIIINPQFADVIPLCGFGDSDLAPVKVQDGEWGYIDRKGKIVINPQFDVATSFINNKVAWVKNKDKWGLIDKEGNILVNPQFKNLTSFYFYSINFNVMEMGNEFFVISQFFNVEAVVDEVMKLVNEKGIDGINPTLTLGSILKKYNKDENKLDSYSNISLKQIDFGNDVEATLVIDGDFYELVSDGWWGMTNVLNKNSHPDKVTLLLKMTGKAEDNKQALASAIASKMGISVLQNDDNYRFATGNYGKYKIEIFDYHAGIALSMSLK